MDPNKPSQETYDQWHNDANNWKLGIFYFNKADQRIFPPKRLKYLGWTINFANPWSILAFVAMLVVVFLIIIYLRNH